MHHVISVSLSLSLKLTKIVYSVTGGGYGDSYRAMSVQGSGQTFLHGYLVIHVREARNIPDMENWYSKLYDKKDVTDPFVDVKLGKAR